MRWTSNRKAEIVEAILIGQLSPADAIKQYELSKEELAAWMRDYLDHGLEGLRVTKSQRLRRRGSGLISVANACGPRSAHPRAGAISVRAKASET